MATTHGTSSYSLHSRRYNPDIDFLVFLTDELLGEYDIISARHDFLTGCFALYRNNPYMRKLLKQSNISRSARYFVPWSLYNPSKNIFAEIKYLFFVAMLNVSIPPKKRLYDKKAL